MSQNIQTDITDAYVLAQAAEDIESSQGYEGNPIEGDVKASAMFENFDLSVERDEESGVISFCVSGFADVHYSFHEYVRTADPEIYELKEWEKNKREEYELFYHISDGQLIEGEAEH